MKKMWLAISLAFVFLGQACADGVPLRGADLAIESITKSLADASASNAAPHDVARQRLQDDVRAFQIAQTNLPPQTAATNWLALYDRFNALPPLNPQQPQNMENGEKPFSLETVIAALPPPAAWASLAEQVDRRPKPAGKNEATGRFLRALVARLNNDATILRHEADALRAAAGKKTEEYEKERVLRQANALTEEAQKLEDAQHPRSVVEIFRQSLAAVTNKTAGARGTVTIMIPDLVALVGRDEATTLIGQALAIPNAYLTVSAGLETRTLARHLALARVEKLTTPQWALISGVDAESMALYEALDRRFPATEKTEVPVETASPFVSETQDYSSRDYNMESARSQALWLHLLSTGCTNTAALPSTFFGRDAWGLDHVLETARRDIPVEKLYATFTTLLKSHPEAASLWHQWSLLALEAGETNNAIAMLRRETAARETRKESAEVQAKLNGVWIRAWLTLDQVDEAVQLMRIAMTNEIPTDARHAQEAFQERIQIATQLAEIGRLLGHADWVKEGLDKVVALEHARLKTEDPRCSYYSSQIYAVLIQHDRCNEAESLLLDVMKAVAKQAASNLGRSSSEPLELPSQLAQLVHVYHAAGRHEDVVKLLEKAPWWNAEDLRDMHADNVTTKIAESLHAVGRDEDARRILKDYLHNHAADDKAYQTLTAIEGPALIPWLDDLYRRDRFEARPLIWKAVLQQKAGKLDDAEATIRLALKVDPTDGHSPKGDRVRAYGVLANILSAKGKSEDAQFFSNVVASVRLAETGDELTEAGLVLRSLPIYEQAQALFANAYCIQWRLAERLAAKGDLAEAEKHYKIAFERMPEQFGEVASLCFGCEGVFRSGHSRSAAERVLTGLVEKGSVRPQVYFLLGQLYEAQDRLLDARAAYEKALALDPNYLDVMEKLYSLHERLFLPSHESDDLALRMLRMDPLQRHACMDNGRIVDLKGLWGVLAENQCFAYDAPKSLLVLAASQQAIKAAKTTHQENANYYQRSWGWNSYGQRSIQTPGEGIAGNQFVRTLLEYMNENTGMGMGSFGGEPEDFSGDNAAVE